MGQNVRSWSDGAKHGEPKGVQACGGVTPGVGGKLSGKLVNGGARVESKDPGALAVEDRVVRQADYLNCVRRPGPWWWC